MKLSIIIPVYGVEKYIKDCVSSCIENIGTKSDDVEVIVVDDGCKDESIKIAHDIVKATPYFKFVTQHNQGLSMARNNGLKAAKGDYVWFVDSDDILPAGAVNIILNIIARNKDFDILEFGYTCVEEDIKREYLSPVINNGITLKYTDGKSKLFRGFNTAVPFHIFRRNFMISNNLLMYPGIYHEDNEFTPRAYWFAETVLDYPVVAYYYRQRMRSIITTPSLKKVLDNIFVANRLQDFFDKKVSEKKMIRKVNSYISMFFCNGLNSTMGLDENSKDVVNKKVVENKKILIALKKSGSIKYIILGTAASIFPNHTVSIYNFLLKFK